MNKSYRKEITVPSGTATWMAMELGFYYNDEDGNNIIPSDKEELCKWFLLKFLESIGYDSVRFDSVSENPYEKVDFIKWGNSGWICSRCGNPNRDGKELFVEPEWKCCPRCGRERNMLRHI